jgi:site-specific recombinase XerC
MISGIPGGEVLRADREALQEHLTVQRWLRDKEPKTVNNYLRNMVIFQRRSGKNPEQFLAWAKTVDSTEVQDMIEKASEGLPASIAFNLKTDMRSYLRHNGYNSLPKAKMGYTLQDWHRGYKKEEVKELLGYINDPLRKLFVYVSAETGLRARTVLALRYRHIKEDFENNVVPCAIRLEPKFYGKKKSAGYTFLGERSVELLRKAIRSKIVETKDDSPLIPASYMALYHPLKRARQRAKLNPKIQPNHGLRKYFEDALDSARVDHERKMMLEGHFAGTRAKHYTDVEWDELRKIYREAYPHIDVDAADTGLGKRILSLEEENTGLRQRVEVLEGQLENADRESMLKLQAAARSMGFDIGVLADEILNAARRRQQESDH